MMFAAAALAAVPLSAPVAPAHAQRQLDEHGTGNCIFAPSNLPFGGEGGAAYRAVTDEFRPGQDVYARCYYNGTVNSFARLGSTFNSIRAEQRYSMNLYWVRPRPDGSLPDDSGLQQVIRGASLNARETGDWDGQLFIFGRQECDLTVPLYDRELLNPYPNNCLNLEQAARHMERRLGLPRQDRAKFCLRVQLLTSDTRRWSLRDDSWTSAPVQDYHPMAGGCFTLLMD